MSEFEKPKLPSTSRKQLSSPETSVSSRTAADVLSRYYQRNRSRLIGLSDATGSMAGVWRTTRDQIHAMLESAGAIGDLQVRWVAYRDYDMGNEIIESSGWHSESAPLVSFVSGIKCKGGGDWPEAVEQALAVAADDPEATRVVLIGDAPPHAERDYRAQARRLAQLQRPVYSFVVGQAVDTHKAFSEISEITGGLCAYLSAKEDLLDLVAMVAAHDISGGGGVEAFLERNAPKLTQGAKTYAQRLLNG